jgi:hypothetical protein
MKLLRTIWLAGFLGLMSLTAQQVSQASAMQPPKFTLTDLGSVDGQANPYTPPTGYSTQGVYSSDIYKPGYRIGWIFTKDGSTTNLLPSDMANQNWYQINGYSSSGVMFGDDTKTGTSFYLNTNTNEYGNFKGSGIYQLGISSVNSTGQAIGNSYLTFKDQMNNSLSYPAPTFYDSFSSDPVFLKDLLTKNLDAWVLLGGTSINDNGHIYGTMFNTLTQQSDYYRLDPVLYFTRPTIRPL